MDESLQRLKREAEANAGDADLAQRYDQALLRAGHTEKVRARYRFKFQCPLRFEALGETGDPRVRACEKCERTVHLCRSAAELREHVAAGRCVAFRRSEVEGALLELASDPRTSSASDARAPCVLSTDLELVDLDADPPDPYAIAMLPRSHARLFEVVPWRYERATDTLVIARAKSDDGAELREDLRFSLGIPDVRFVLAEPAALARVLEEHYPLHDDEPHLMGDVEFV